MCKIIYNYNYILMYYFIHINMYKQEKSKETAVI